MNMKTYGFLLKTVLLLLSVSIFANDGSSLPRLSVSGKNMVDPHGNKVVLHGFAQTYSPWFNEEGTKWTNYNVAGCLDYNQGIIDSILNAGWKMNFLRLHMDPYWSNIPGCSGRYEGEECFDESRFIQYLDEVFVPMAEYAISKGLYVVMRPPGVCPDSIKIGGVYQNYLLKVWSIVSNHPVLKNNPGIMLELANEPIKILGTDGTYGAGTQGHFDNLKTYFQEIVDTIRVNADNILWVPGLGYQSLYKGYAMNPIEGKNIGYAVHIYPGWFGSANGYDVFKSEWDINVQPVADFAPIMVTEMDWAPEKYNASWGKDSTGIAGGMGFGANFKKITDDAGNISWLLFTSPHYLAQFDSVPPEEGEAYTFLNDPQACPWPIYHWYKEYAKVNYPRPEFEYCSHSDNGDGTYTNPVIFGDYPDPDVIRVEDTYYMVSTTMHIFPGATILKSYDLVNWEYCCNPLQKIENSACYNLDGCNRYSHGQWASSLKYNNDTFYLHFNTLDEGSYLLTTQDIEGTWSKRKLTGSYYDAGLLFDNGNIYISHGINNIYITQLDENFEEVTKQQVISESDLVKTGLEGGHLYKIGGYYYIYATYGGWPAYQVAFRSTSIFGPYEQQPTYFDDDNIHQGALIQTQSGEWWTMLFYDKGAYGRFPNLQPITWVDDWPVIGVDGKGVTTYIKPDVGKEFPVQSLPTNDNFRDYKLGAQWGWSHNPDNSKWSLTNRPDYLRLMTVSVVDSLQEARNTLTQRILGYSDDLDHSYGTIKMEINNMKEGDVAGLAVFQDPYAYIGVSFSEGVKKLVMFNKGTTTNGSVINDSVIYLRAVAGYNTGKATFSYSLDNSTYTPLGTELEMKYDLSVFTGNKFCLFNYATVDTGGYVDIDWFSTEEKFNEDTFYDSSFTGYTAEELTVTDLVLESTNMVLLTGSTTSLNITAVYEDGHTEDVSIGASYSNPNPYLVEINNGRIISKRDGEVTITVSYKGKLGEPITKQFTVVSSKFPLTNKHFNPNIWTTGSFDESTHTLITGQYGFGGWHYDNGIDLSGYKYLVLKTGNTNTCGYSFRIFDENNYWSAPDMYDVGSNHQVVVDLQNMYKNGTTTKMNPSTIFYVGFWSTGGCELIINDVYVTNNEDYSKPNCTDSYRKIDATICVGDYFRVGDSVFSESGNYIIGLMSSEGCDSIVDLNLSVKPVNIQVTLSDTSLSADAIGAAYQWLDCNADYNIINGATEKSYSPTSNSNYAVQISQNGCIDTSSCYTLSENTLVESNFKNLINIYPNPTNGNLNIDLNKNYNKITIRLKSVTGQILSVKNYYNIKELSLFIDENPGIYVLEIYSDEGEQIIVKVIKT